MGHVTSSVRARRRALGAGAILALSSLAVGVDARAQQDQPPDFTLDQTLTPTGHIVSDEAPSSSLAETDRTLLAREDARPVQVAIKLDYDAVAVYGGGVEGFEATSPMVTGIPLSERPGAAARYEEHVAGQEAAFVDALRAEVPSAEIGTSLRTVYGGISAIIPANAVETVLAIPGVVAVQKDDLRQLLTDSSPEFVNATALYDEFGTTANAGEGLILGNLDTGVWPEHPSFADKGNLPPPGGPERACEFGDNPLTPAPDVFQCQNKLIGGQAFSDGYFARPRPSEPFPDTARDSNGHGTHTSSTSAGNILDHAPVFGVDRGPLHGIAPGAYIIEYKVCYLQGCSASDSAAAVQQAILDGVDVINFSISGGNNPFNDPVELAFLDAYAAGVFVSASAGNDGPGASTVNHRSPWTTTVAASTQTREFATTLSLTASNGETFTADGASITAGAGPLPVVLAQNVPGYNPTGTALARAQCAAAPTSPTVFDGLIVACQRGVQARVWKGFVVRQGGGEGMVLYNPAQADTETDNHWLPTVHLADGTDFLSFMNSHTGVTGSFPAGEKRDGQGDVMAAFSSRGPAGLFLKPDITAPGVQILASASPFPATPDPVEGGGPPGELFQAIAGTSMSSPHVAGAGLLLKAAHPDWNPGQIKSALMTTATTDVLKETLVTAATPLDMGSGRIDIGAASAAPVTFSDTAANFFAMANDPANAVHLNIPSIYAPAMPGRLVTTRVATNPTEQRQRFEVDADAPVGSTISVSPSKFSLNPDESVTLTITIESDAPIGQQQFGSIELVERGGAQLHLPVAFVHAQAGVRLEQSCTPASIRERTGVSTCTVAAANNSFEDQTVDLDTFLSRTLRVAGANGAEVVNNRQVQLHDVALDGMLPGVPSVDNGTTPAGGFLDLAAAGVAPTVIGDEDILQFTSSPFQFNGEVWTSFGVVSNGYLVVGDSSIFDIVRDPPAGLNPARPNNVIAPLWTDLDAPSVRVAAFSAGPTNARSTWIVAQWNARVQGSAQAEVFQIWFGLSNDATPAQDVSFSYGTGSPTNPGQAVLVGAENKFGEGDMVATLPTQPQRVTSTGVTLGGMVSYTVAVTGNQPGGGEVRTEMTASRMAGTAIARSLITVTAR